MENNLIIALTLVGLALVGMLLMLTTNQNPAISVSGTPAFVVATLEDLKHYPAVKDPSPRIEVVRQFAVRLPDNDLVVVLRPILREEYNSFQVQAIAPELIEWQMLATALQAPTADEVDFTALPADLILFLKVKINEISGFSVFETDLF